MVKFFDVTSNKVHATITLQSASIMRRVFSFACAMSMIYHGWYSIVCSWCDKSPKGESGSWVCSNLTTKCSRQNMAAAKRDSMFVFVRIKTPNRE